MQISYSPVAQSVEQLTVNQWVTGSSPVRGASFIKGSRKITKFKNSFWDTGGAPAIKSFNNNNQNHF